MNTNTRPSADHALHASPSYELPIPMEEVAYATGPRSGPAASRAREGRNRKVFMASPPPYARHDDPLPLNDFLKDLHREKRRSERSQAPLSLVLYEIDSEDMRGTQRVDRLLEVLHGAKREIDILGHVGNGTIAVLCPDTDEEGTRGFMRKIDSLAGELPFSAVAAQYPDDLFESLAEGTRVRPAFQPFLVHDASIKGGRGYALKRPLDIVGALVALMLLAPVMLLVAAAVGLTSRGPIIFRQIRLGEGGVPFTFYKFRSMVTNVDDRIHREFVSDLIKNAQADDPVAEAKGAPFKIQRDPRVTRVGRFIRKTSIDELPQLFNVLKGEMSLVGPRPAIPYEAEQYQPWHLRRILSIKPGITGLWQVEGRSKVSFNEMVRMDLRYIRDCSLALDIKIMLRTFLVVIRCEGAV